jgi:hypothetical protein
MEGHKFAKLKILDPRTSMATGDRKRTWRLHFDGRMERTGEMAAESMSASTVVKRAEGFGAHRVTF